MCTHRACVCRWRWLDRGQDTSGERRGSRWRVARTLSRTGRCTAWCVPSHPPTNELVVYRAKATPDACNPTWCIDGLASTSAATLLRTCWWVRAGRSCACQWLRLTHLGPMDASSQILGEVSHWEFVTGGGTHCHVQFRVRRRVRRGPAPTPRLRHVHAQAVLRRDPAGFAR